MFGHQDHPDDQNDNNHPEPQADATLTHDAPVHDNIAPAGTPPVSHPADIDDDTAGDFIMSEPPQHTQPEQPSVNDVPGDDDSRVQSDAPVSEDLLELKQGALQQLAPLLDHLDQTPEEKFRTTMMMIQASDNQALLQTAYETAQKITDEKARAQALLDVVNEINYFTQQGASDESSEE
jgi:hypothetical protein